MCKVLEIKILKRFFVSEDKEVNCVNEITYVDVDGVELKISTINGKVTMYDLSFGDINNVFYDIPEDIIEVYKKAVEETANYSWYKIANCKDWSKEYYISTYKNSAYVSDSDPAMPGEFKKEFKAWKIDGIEPSKIFVTRVLVTEKQRWQFIEEFGDSDGCYAGCTECNNCTYFNKLTMACLK